MTGMEPESEGGPQSQDWPEVEVLQGFFPRQWTNKPIKYFTWTYLGVVLGAMWQALDSSGSVGVTAAPTEDGYQWCKGWAMRIIDAQMLHADNEEDWSADGFWTDWFTTSWGAVAVDGPFETGSVNELAEVLTETARRQGGQVIA